jgi:hypothetical protein
VIELVFKTRLAQQLLSHSWPIKGFRVPNLDMRVRFSRVMELRQTQLNLSVL